MLRAGLFVCFCCLAMGLFAQAPAAMQAQYETLLQQEAQALPPDQLYNAWRSFLTTYADEAQRSDAARHMLNEATTYMLQHRRYLVARSQPPIDFNAPPVTYPTRYIGSHLRYWQRNEYVRYVDVPPSEAGRVTINVATMMGYGFSPYSFDPWGYGFGPSAAWGGSAFGYSPWGMGSMWGSPFGYSPWGW